MESMEGDRVMRIGRFVLNHFGTNTYVVAAKSGGPALVIDPGGPGLDEVYRYLENNGLHVACIVNTHGHADHILGLEPLRRKTGAPLWIHRLDAEMLTSPEKNLSRWMGDGIVCRPAERLLEDGEELEVAGLWIKVLHTPGHTPGSICLDVAPVGEEIDPPVLFTGDTLFRRSVGRTDFPGGDSQQLLASIEKKLLPYPDATVIYPGHEEMSTIGEERAANPFL
jgi:hydroxyacylglutathione hydrolase